MSIIDVSKYFLDILRDPWKPSVGVIVTPYEKSEPFIFKDLGIEILQIIDSIINLPMDLRGFFRYEIKRSELLDSITSIRLDRECRSCVEIAKVITREKFERIILAYA